MQILPMAKVESSTPEKKYQNGDIVELADLKEEIIDEEFPAPMSRLIFQT